MNVSCSKKEESSPPTKETSTKTKQEEKIPIFSLEMTTEPKDVRAGAKTIFTFITKSTDTNGIEVPVVIAKNSVFDVVIANDNLSYMEHTIAKPQKDGTYATTTSLPSGGKYFAFTSFQPQNTYAVTFTKTIEAKGSPSLTLAPEKDTWESSADDISFRLSTIGEKFITGVLSMGFVSLTSKGKSLDSSRIQDLYGAKVHLFLIGAATKEYFHIYPETQDDKFIFHAFFKKSDRYEGRLMLMINKKLHTIPLTINVHEGSKEEIKEKNEMHSHFHTSDTPKKQGD